jgi:hypothetical protein
VPTAVGVSQPARSFQNAPPTRKPWPAIVAVVGMVLAAACIIAYVIVHHGEARTSDAPRSSARTGAEAPSTPADGRLEPLALSAPEPEADGTRRQSYRPAPDRRSRLEMPVARSTLPVEKQEAVNRAIERGVSYLKRKQIDSGSWESHSHAIGNAALPGLTLMECGVPAGDPAVQKATALVRREQAQMRATYELSLSVLFLERLGDQADRPLVQEMAARLVAGQQSDGGWHYHCPILDSAQQEELVRRLDRMRTGSSADSLKPAIERTPQGEAEEAPAKPRPKGKGAKAGARLKNVPALRENLEIRREPNSGQSDNSNSQFAILALWAAQRQNVPVERALALAAKRFRPCQNEDGGWGYHSGGEQRDGSKPSMTCVGLLALAVGHGLGRDEAPGRGSVQDEQIQNAMNALGKRVGKPINDGGYDLYFLWSLERVGVLYGLDKIGGGDWYAWGTDFLLRKQSKGGEWSGSHYHGATPTLDTCFALLFLKRANFTHDLTTKIEFLKIVPQSEQ